MCQLACVYDGTHASELCDDCMEDAYDLDVLCRKDPEQEPGCKPATDEEWLGHYLDETVSPAEMDHRSRTDRFNVLILSGEVERKSTSAMERSQV